MNCPGCNGYLVVKADIVAEDVILNGDWHDESCEEDIDTQDHFSLTTPPAVTADERGLFTYRYYRQCANSNCDLKHVKVVVHPDKISRENL